MRLIIEMNALREVVRRLGSRGRVGGGSEGRRWGSERWEVDWGGGGILAGRKGSRRRNNSGVINLIKIKMESDSQKIYETRILVCKGE
jgi:hypothetical protein